MAGGAVKHDYHLVDPSPWPFTGSLGAFVLAIGLVVQMAGLSTNEESWAYFFLGKGQPIILLLGALIVGWTMFGWWGDIIKESRKGDHTPVVDLGLRYGMILFIVSEVMFFVAWFWMFFEAALFHEVRAGAELVRAGHRRGLHRLGKLAAAGRGDLRSVPPAAHQHADPAVVGHHGDLGAPRAAA